jgi:hypothetical protein
MTKEETFTEEQVTELINKAKAMEQWKISGDQFYRLSIVHISTLAQQGAVDNFIVQAGQILYDSFKKANAIGQGPKPTPAPAEKEAEEE